MWQTCTRWVDNYPAKLPYLNLYSWNKHMYCKSQEPRMRPQIQPSICSIRSSPFPLLHHLHEIFEEIMRVVWAGRSFGVILHAEQRQIFMPQAFKRVVVQIDVREFNFTLRQRIGINGKIMIVRGNFNFAGVHLLHRMIAAVVAELELVCLTTKRKTGELMSQTNTEYGHTAHQAANVVHRVGARLRVARTV